MGDHSAGPEPEPDSAAYGLKTLYDCRTAEVEYVMTLGLKGFHSLMVFPIQYCRSPWSEWPPGIYIYCFQRHVLAKVTPARTEPKHSSSFFRL